jgi:transcriptional regulator with XRE-family HTH domain
VRTRPTTLHELRQQRGLTLAAMSVLAGADASALSKIEAGQARATPPTIVKLARALGIDARRMARLCDAAWLELEQREVSGKSEDLRRIDVDAIAGAR